MSTTVVSAARRLIQTQEGIFTKYPTRIVPSASNSLPLNYWRSFHNSRVVSAKDPKKDIKGTVTSKSVTPQSVGKPAVVNSENVPRTVIRPPESLADIKANIAKLVDEEVEFLNESSGVAGALSSDVAKEFLEQSKFTLTPLQEGQIFQLVKKVDGAEILVEFNRYDEDAIGEDFLDQKENGQEEQDEDEEQEEDEEGQEGSLKEDEQFAMKQKLRVEIAFKDSTGAVKGRWYLFGHSGKDNRLYVTEMAVSKGAEQKKTDELSSLPFDSMSDDMQDRIYDYLDEVGIDDQLATFVKAYVVDLEGKAAVGMLQDLKELLKA